MECLCGHVLPVICTDVLKNFVRLFPQHRLQNITVVAECEVAEKVTKHTLQEGLRIRLCEELRDPIPIWLKAL